jgi:hypothetical protein
MHSDFRRPFLGLLFAILVGLALGNSALASAAMNVEEFDFQRLEAGGEPSTAAGAHPYEVKTRFLVASHEAEGSVLPDESIRNLSVELPPGFIGNPTAVATCEEVQLQTDTEESTTDGCPLDSQVGWIALKASFFTLNFPVYKLKAPPGVAAQFGFKASTVVVHLQAKVEPGAGGYKTRLTLVDLPQTFPWTESTTTFWGVPADPSHDEYRGSCLGLFGPTGSICETRAAKRPLLSNPTSCSPSLTATARANSWQDPTFITTSDTQESGGRPVGSEDCARLPFKPTLTVDPTASASGEPTGLDVRLEVPQQNLNPIGSESSHLKDVEMTLPPGMTVNASSANGLGSCSEAAVDLAGAAADTCPAASRIGSVKIATPLLEDDLEGGVFVATQGSNPFKSLLALYLAVADPRTGVVIKLPGKISPDPVTGQLTVSFENNPQLPFESLDVRLKGGSRAPLVLPSSCGTYRAEAELTPWARPDQPISRSSSFEVDGNCGTTRFDPGFSAGTLDPTGGSYSPFLLRVTREDGEQNLAKVEATLPEGLLAKLKGVPLCSGAAAASGECPAASQVGRAVVGAGSGSQPLFLPEPGKSPTAIYLDGPYKGAPYSLVVEVPAQAGPFDLGDVVVRTALRIDPVTTRVTAESDPLPQILQGIPIAYRDVRVQIDRDNFMLNPTSCRDQRITSTLTSSAGATASPSDRFAVAGCRELGFGPSLKLSLKGKMNRTGNPALTATLKAPKGQANIAKTTVILPKSEFIDNAHISNPCTRVQFNANACPASSILGAATAVSPLLDKPLSGPVYFRSNGGDRELPDLVADLDGQIHVTLVGFIDTAKSGGVRTRFQNVPDAPVSKFTIKLKGGKKGLIENSENLCSFAPKAKVQMTGQNGKTANSNLKLVTSCGKAKPKK